MAVTHYAGPPVRIEAAWCLHRRGGALLSDLSVVLAGVPVGVAAGVRRVPASESDLLSLATTTPEDTTVLALVSTAAPRRHAELARAAARGDHVVLVDEPPPVSRTWLMGEAVSRLAATHPASLLVAVLPELRSHVASRVVLGSVASLQEPAPSLSQHARSWLPSARFVTDMHEVHTREHPTRLAPGDPHAVVLHGEGRLSEAWARELVDESGLPVTAVPWEDSSPWGCSHWAEISVWTRSLDDVVRDVLDSVESKACGWCDRTVVAGRTCPFCRSVVGSTVGRAT